jgi:hypothetical protein
MDWEGLKGAAAELFVAKDALHIYAAFAVQVAAALVLRRPLSSWLPWLATLGAALLNEALDIVLSVEREVGAWQIDGARHDMLNTMALPTVLMLLCRYLPRLFGAGSGAPACAPNPLSDGGEG